jgi:hypothetical protein
VLAKGFSGVRASTLRLGLEMLNRGVTPVVPERGSVGASGDLAPLAHLALVLIGEGEAFFDGVRMSGRDALRKAGLEPVVLEAKEGLTLVNGTQAMCAVGVPSLLAAEELAELFDLAGAIAAMAADSSSEHRLYFTSSEQRITNHELIRTIAEGPKVARYIDIPLQHISDNMLGAMQRETSGDYIRDLIKRIRAGIPGIAVRTTFIVGFPGETEADVAELETFIRETKFERLGVFRYSQEEGTRGAKMENQIPAKTKEARWHRLMKLQQEIAAGVSQSHVGQTLRVLVEEPGIARGDADAPDIDGRVYVTKDLPVGEFATVKISGFQDYDLLALPRGQRPAEFKVAKQAQ